MAARTLNAVGTTLLQQVVDLASRAGAVITAGRTESKLSIGFKEDNSPVCSVDLASHKEIVHGLAALTPTLPILSEESCIVSFDERRAWEGFWLVDPLDGTKEFLAGSNDFTVNIALIIQHRPVLGVICAPALNTLYYASVTAGAWISRRGRISRIRAMRPPGASPLLVASKSHSWGEADGFGGGSTPYEILRMGSSLKLCFVADGTADLYPRTAPTMEWDTAAGDCILHQAGGSLLDFNGNALVYNKPVLINPSFVASGLQCRTNITTPITR